MLRGAQSVNGSACVDELYNVVVTARRQTAGRGRGGSVFISPGGDSIYVSFILKLPENPATQRITAFAALAVCLALEKTTLYRPDIKWINDVLVDGRKVCGILAEAGAHAVVLGIGVNINIDKKDLPDELLETAGVLCMGEKTRAKFFDALVEEVFRCTAISGDTFMDEYRARSILIGKPIALFRRQSPEDAGSAAVLKDVKSTSAFCEGIANDGALIVRYEDGSVEELRTSDVSVRLAI